MKTASYTLNEILPKHYQVEHSPERVLITER